MNWLLEVLAIVRHPFKYRAHQRRVREFNAALAAHWAHRKGPDVKGCVFCIERRERNQP